MFHTDDLTDQRPPPGGSLPVIRRENGWDGVEDGGAACMDHLDVVGECGEWNFVVESTMKGDRAIFVG